MPTPSTLRKKIGVAIIQALPVNTTVWDSDIRGFCARRQRSEAVSYLLKCRVDGRIRWFTIGQHGQPADDGQVWTPDKARKQAIKILANPSAFDKPPPAKDLTFEAVAAQFVANHGKKIKASTLKEYSSLLRMYLLPALGPKRITAITRADVSNAHSSWNHVPRAANHALSVLSKIMTWAEDQGYRPEGANPCQRVQRYKENKRERFLTKDELARLGAALDQAEAEQLAGPYAIAALRLLIFTGARLNEILTLKWSEVDLERRLIFLSDSKTGKKPLALNAPAVDVLTSLPRFANNPYVIVGHRYGSHLVNLQKPWQQIRAVAGLDTVRIHDLRHTFASVAVASGGSLPVLGRQLGHSQSQTTQRYAHLADDPVRQLTEATGETLASALGSKPRM
ncbi:MAG: site-specific integrase [Hyphomicrobiaceae bacterium]|nr:site-specific integrase [Hyphomicrobiaceae bacterium]